MRLASLAVAGFALAGCRGTDASERAAENPDVAQAKANLSRQRLRSLLVEGSLSGTAKLLRREIDADREGFLRWLEHQREPGDTLGMALARIGELELAFRTCLAQETAEENLDSLVGAAASIDPVRTWEAAVRELAPEQLAAVLPRLVEYAEASRLPELSGCLVAADLNEAVRTEALTKALDRWIGNDPAGASVWVSEQALSNEVIDHFATGIVFACDSENRDPVTARQWAEVISDDSLRERALEAIGREEETAGSSPDDDASANTHIHPRP